MTSVLPPSAAPATSAQTPQPEPATPGNEGRKTRFAMIFGIVISVVTVVAIALAVVAPLLSPVLDPLSDGWQKIYDSSSQSFNATTWDESNGCNVTSDGLHAETEARCNFKPSQSGDLTSKGFVIDATLAPPSAVRAEQVPVILISDTVFVGIDQLGSFALCVRTCDPSSVAAVGGARVTGQANDWHAATDVANTIAIRVTVDGTTNTLQFFTNGQYVASLDVSSVSLYSATLTLGADAGAEALFTRAAIYSASA